MTARDWFGLVVRTVGLLYALLLLGGWFMLGVGASGSFWFAVWWGVKLALSLFLLFRADVIVRRAYRYEDGGVS